MLLSLPATKRWKGGFQRKHGVQRFTSSANGCPRRPRLSGDGCGLRCFPHPASSTTRSTCGSCPGYSRYRKLRSKLIGCGVEVDWNS